MRDRRISQGQLRALLLLALLPLATERLPGRMAQAGSAAWLCPLLAGAVALGLGLLLSRRPKDKTVDLGRQFAARWGRGPGQLLAGLFLLWGLFLLTAHACRVGGRLADSLGTSPALLTGAVLLLAGWMASEGVPAFARACEIFALAVGFGFGMIVLFGVFRLRWDYILLWSGEELGQVPGGALGTLGTLAVGCYALFFLGDVKAAPGERKRNLRQLVILFLLVTVGILLVLGRFGPALTGTIDRPFFQMVSGLGFEGAFQRLEQLASALWLLGDVALLGLLLLSVRRLLAQVMEREERRRMGWLLLIPVFLLAFSTAFWNGVLDGAVLPVGNLVAGAGMLVFGVEKRKNEKK